MIECALALCGVQPMVLDCLADAGNERKANALGDQIVRMIDMHGLYHEFGGWPGSHQWVASGVCIVIPLVYAEAPGNPISCVADPLAAVNAASGALSP